MAYDYYPLLFRTVAALESNTPEARQDVYDRVRQMLERHFQESNQTASEKTKGLERLALEDAISRVENEATAKSRGRGPEARPRPDQLATEREVAGSINPLTSQGRTKVKYEYKVDYLEASVTDRDVRRGDAWQKTSAQVEVKLTEANKQGWEYYRSDVMHVDVKKTNCFGSQTGESVTVNILILVYRKEIR
jgi:hypothetical protein